MHHVGAMLRSSYTQVDIEAAVRRELSEVVESLVAPSIAVGFQGPTSGTWVASAGDASPSSWFDLASVTKPFTACLFGEFVARGAASWSALLRDLLPTTSGTLAGDQDFLSLLSHRSGLAAHVNLYRALEAGEPYLRNQLLRQAATSRKPGGSPPAVYSDLGYLLTGAALEAEFGRELDVLLHETLLASSGLAIGSARQVTQQAANAHFVPTEYVPYRGGRVAGLVHDDNAWAISGRRISGHAGLFGTIHGVLDFGSLLLDRLEGRGALALDLPFLTQRRDASTWRIGFDGVSGPASLFGTLASGESFGHLGFTGTSLLVDPERRVAVAVLSNRVYFGRDNAGLRPRRPRLHDLLLQLSGAGGGRYG